MPFDLTQGSTAQFNVAFFDTTGALTTPPSATLTVTYTTLAGTSTSATLALSAVGSGVWTATWGSAVAALGAAGYSVIAPGQATPSTGALRIVQTGPQS